MDNHIIEAEKIRMNDENFQKRIKAYARFLSVMNSKNVTPYNVSKNTGIATSTLSDWKNGKSMPKQDKMAKIAKYLEVSAEYLMTGEESKKDNKQKQSEPELSPDVRAAARGMMELSEEKRKIAIEMINFLSEQGRNAKES